MKIFNLVLFLLPISLCAAPAVVDFDIACGKEDRYYQTFYQLCAIGEDCKTPWLGGYSHCEAFQVLRDIFKSKFIRRALYEPIDKYRIPKTIHIIWMGSPFPKEYKGWLDSWKSMHADWNVMLWTDKTLKNFKMLNRDLFDAARSHEEKVDMLRIELLYQFGGLCIDTDCQCLKSFDEIHRTCDFFAGMAHMDIFGVNMAGILIPNIIMGSIARHPLLAKVMENMRHFKQMPTVSERTGAWLFTRSFFEYVSQGVDQFASIIFPPSYFYPVSDHAREKCGKEYAASCIKKETYATRHYETSWAK